ncbi:MAG: hypothetical protein M3P98_02950 [bacterium]|nr:hypothetical protein [bacterium]MDQ3159064.1 hypothetical protein [bacterium]
MNPNDPDLRPNIAPPLVQTPVGAQLPPANRVAQPQQVQMTQQPQIAVPQPQQATQQPPKKFSQIISILLILIGTSIAIAITTFVLFNFT